jgi:hypothetical protein
MSREKGPNRVEEMVESLREWQAIERQAMEQTAEIMRNRTDWGELLQPVSLPEETEQPPTGKEVKVLNKPKW